MNDVKLAEQLKEVCNSFRIEGNLIDYEINTIGNINTTYKVLFRRSDGMEKSYIMQKINTYVFKNPTFIMSNIDYVTSHIRAKNCSKPSLHFHHTESGHNYYSNSGSCFWRLCNYIDSVTYNVCCNPEILHYAGQAFGEFQMQLSDFDASKLSETIPDFHNTKKRLDKLFADVEADEYGRAASVQPEIDYIRSMREIAYTLNDLLGSGEIPLRVTHNDTKVNNVLFDKNTNEPLTVIDLDTVMPGLAMHDFGDAVRSAANTAAEDEKDLSKVTLDLGLFRAFSEGFISQTAGALTKKEIGTMALGALTITIELASRFLDDYITGDKYFKVNYEGHNIDRTRCQLKLAQDMVEKFDEMNAIIKEITDKTKEKTVLVINIAEDSNIKK
ncbi:MAG: phosphotransferase enzyme family protein [Eubacteriales bacterium]